MRRRCPTPAGGGRKQAGRDIEQRRLSAAGGTDDRNELAVGDVERRALDRGIEAAVRPAGTKWSRRPARPPAQRPAAEPRPLPPRPARIPPARGQTLYPVPLETGPELAYSRVRPHSLKRVRGERCDPDQRGPIAGDKPLISPASISSRLKRRASAPPAQRIEQAAAALHDRLLLGEGGIERQPGCLLHDDGQIGGIERVTRGRYVGRFEVDRVDRVVGGEIAAIVQHDPPRDRRRRRARGR